MTRPLITIAIHDPETGDCLFGTEANTLIAAINGVHRVFRWDKERRQKRAAEAIAEFMREKDWREQMRAASRKSLGL